MVKKIVITAILAALASAAPTSNHMAPRTFNDSSYRNTSTYSTPITSINRTTSTYSAPITSTKGWSIDVALAIEACAVGVTSDYADSNSKEALAAWIVGGGAAFFDPAICREIKAWCTTTAEIALGASAQAAIEAALLVESSISVAGGVVAFLNGVIESGFNGGACACSPLPAGDRGLLSIFLSGFAGEVYDSAIAGSLQLCAAGGIAETLSASAQASLSNWLSEPNCPLSAGLKRSVQGWLSRSVVGGPAAVGHNSSHTAGGNVGAVGRNSSHTIVGGAGAVGRNISHTAGGNVVFGASAIASLVTFIGGSEFTILSLEIQAALRACATGGASSALSDALQAALSAWLSSPSCPMAASLKASVQAWLAGTIGSSTQAGTSAVEYAYISLGASIHGNLDAAGHLIGSAQASLSSFCSSPAGLALVLELELDILASLKSCASGKLASSLEAAAAAALAKFLTSPSCPLDSEMRGSIMLWLSFGINSVSGASAGVGKGAGAGFDIAASVAAELFAFVSAGRNISSTCKGALAVAIAGEAADACSSVGRAELAAYLVSGEAAGLGAEAEAVLFGWVMGSDCSGAM